MSTVPLRLSGPVAPTEADAAEPEEPSRNRRLLPVLIAVVVAVATIATASALAPKTIPMRQVLVVSTAVGPGEPVAASDWRTAFVPKSAGINAMVASQAQSLVGKVTSQAWVPGTPISAGMLGGAPASDVIGLSLRPGQVPTGLTPGDHVIVVAMAQSGNSATVAGDVLGVVETVRPDTAGNLTNTNISVPASPTVVAHMITAASAGDVSVVLENG